MKLTFNSHYLIAFWITLILSIALIITGFFMPPVGEISGSVITAVGELFLWPALGFAAKALSEGKKATFSKGDTTLSVGNSE